MTRLVNSKRPTPVYESFPLKIFHSSSRSDDNDAVVTVLKSGTTLTGWIVDISGNVMLLHSENRLSVGETLKVEGEDTLWLGHVLCNEDVADGYVVSIRLEHALIVRPS